MCKNEVRTFRFISQILNAEAKGKGDEYFNVLDVTLSTVKWFTPRFSVLDVLQLPRKYLRSICMKYPYFILYKSVLELPLVINHWIRKYSVYPITVNKSDIRTGRGVCEPLFGEWYATFSLVIYLTKCCRGLGGFVGRKGELGCCGLSSELNSYLKTVARFRVGGWQWAIFCRAVSSVLSAVHYRARHHQNSWILLWVGGH